MSYSVKFRINLLHDGNYFQNESEVATAARFKSIYLPLGPYGGSPSFVGKHGDTFTLYGLQAAYLKRLVSNGLLKNVEVDDANAVEEVGPLSLFFIGRLNNPQLSFYPISISESGLLIGPHSGNLSGNDEEDIDDGYAAYNLDDEFLYVVGEYDSGNEFFMYKVDPTTLERTEVSVPGFTSIVNCYINDGGDDMYDNGNVLNTNLGYGIQYTHTQRNDEEDYATDGYPMDGSVQDGSSYFGSGSTYFTNMYEAGLFVLFAKGISIDQFFVSGELGADGSGTATQGVFTVNDGPTEYTVFYKKVFDANDKSVNHLMIVPGGNIGITHTISNDTDSDFDMLRGLTGKDRLIYLLFAGDSGNSNVSEEDMIALVTKLFESASPSMNNLSITLSDITSNAAEILAEVSNAVTFTDEVSDPFTIGASGIKSITYSGDNNFYVLIDSTLYSLTASGQIMYIGENETLNFVRSIAYHNGVLYGVGESSKISIIDTDTAEAVVDDNKIYLSWAEDGPTINSMGSICSLNGKLYAVAYLDSYWPYLVEINVENYTISLVNESTITDEVQELFVMPTITVPNSIGISTPEFYGYQGYFFYSEDQDVFVLPKLYARQEDWVTENIYAEWTLSAGFPDVASWTPISLTVIETEGAWRATTTKPTEEQVVFRVRFVNDNSGNWFYFQID
jgi:hypothetical protein